MSRKVVNETVPEEVKNVDHKVTYENVTTTGNLFRDNQTPPINVVFAKNEDPELVVVTPKDDRKTFMAGKWFTLKRGEQLAVTPEVKSQLAASRLIVEDEDAVIPDWIK